MEFKFVHGLSISQTEEVMRQFYIHFVALISLTQACQTVTDAIGLSARVKTVETVKVPYIKNSANECYFLDEFMPLPDGMVTGKSGNLSLRYYNYKAADFKDWESKQIVLAFYSSDDRCWSLFEEYYVH
jgi:hypothetical protein